MSPAQRTRYFRYWQEAFRAHWSGVRGGEPIARPGRPQSLVRDQVVAVAGQLAAASHLTPDHLRHACHVLALGQDKPALDLTNKEQDLVVALFHRLAESGRELAGQMRLDQRATELARMQPAPAAEPTPAPAADVPWEQRRPDADRKRVMWAINHSGYPEGAIAALAADKFETSNWRGLPDRELYQLMITVKARAARQAARRSPAATRQLYRKPAETLVLEAQ